MTLVCWFKKKIMMNNISPMHRTRWESSPPRALLHTCLRSVAQSWVSKKKRNNEYHIKSTCQRFINKWHLKSHGQTLTWSSEKSPSSFRWLFPKQVRSRDPADWVDKRKQKRGPRPRQVGNRTTKVRRPGVEQSTTINKLKSEDLIHKWTLTCRPTDAQSDSRLATNIRLRGGTGFLPWSTRQPKGCGTTLAPA